MREGAPAADCEGSANVDGRTPGIVLLNVQQAANIAYSSFIEEAAAERVRVADCMILPEYLLCGSEASPESKVARHVRLITMIQMIAVRQVIGSAKTMIDSEDVIPEVERPWQRNDDRPNLNRRAVNQSGSQVVVIRDLGVNLRQKP